MYETTSPGDNTRLMPLNVFWLDDQPSEVSTWIKVIETWGNSVRLFEHGAEMIEAISEMPDSVDVILVDAYMQPDEAQGVEVLSEIHQRWEALRGVLVTGKTQQFDEDYPDSIGLAFLEEIAFSLITKPIEGPELRWLLSHVRREKALEQTFRLDRVGPQAVKQILESMDDEVMVIDLEDGPRKHEVLYVNEARRRVHGEDVVGSKCFEHLAEAQTECQSCVCVRANESHSGTAVTYDHPCRRPDGSVYHVSEHSSVFTDRGRRFAVNVVRNEEARHQLGLLASSLTAVDSEVELFLQVTKRLRAMGYGRVRAYRILERDKARYLVPVVCDPTISAWIGSSDRPFTIPLDGDRYFAETVRSADSGIYTAWVFGEPQWADVVALDQGEAWVECVIRRFGTEYALLAVDDHKPGGRNPNQEDRAIVGQLGKLLSQSVELLNDRRERRFLEALFQETGKCDGPLKAVECVVRLFKRYLAADACGVFMLEPNSNVLYRFFGLWGRAEEERDFDFEEQYILDEPRRRGITGELFLRANEATLVPRVKREPALHDEYCREYERLLGDEVHSALYLPLIAQGKSIGMLRALNRRDAVRGQLFDFSEAQRRTAELALGQITPVIQDLLEVERQQVRAARLKALFEITRALSEEVEPTKVMEVIAAQARNLLSARACSVFTLAEPEEKYQLCRDGHLPPDGINSVVFRLRASTDEFFHQREADGKPVFYLEGEAEDGVVAGRSGVVRRNGQRSAAPIPDKFYAEGRAYSTDLIATRLLTREGQTAGMIVLLDKVTASGRLGTTGFSEDDEELLRTLARQASLAIGSSSLHQSRERMLRRIETLHSLTEVFETERDKERVMHLFLTGLTIGDGLGFNRAVLFLPDRAKMKLSAVMAVGATDEEEAHKTWEDLARRDFSFSEASRLLREAGYDRNSPLHRSVQSLCFELDPRTQSLPVAAFFDGCSRRIDLARESVSIAQPVREVLGTGAFAIAPVKAQGEVFGLVYVDNKFNARPIRDEDMRLLDIFCAKGAIALVQQRAIENAAQAEALRSLESAHDLTGRFHAHCTRADEAARALREDPPDQARSLHVLAGLEEELKDTWELFDDLRAKFGSDARRAASIDLSSFLGDLIPKWKRRWEGIEFNCELRGTLVIRTIPSKVTLVLTELVTNAATAMRQSGSVRVLCEAPNEIDIERLGGTSPKARIVVQDTGDGLEPGANEEVFTEGYSRTGGSGVGLFAARRSAREHLGGDLFVEPSDHGARFVVLLGDIGQ